MFQVQSAPLGPGAMRLQQASGEARDDVVREVLNLYPLPVAEFLPVELDALLVADAEATTVEDVQELVAFPVVRRPVVHQNTDRLTVES